MGTDYLSKESKQGKQIKRNPARFKLEEKLFNEQFCSSLLDLKLLFTLI